MYSILKLIFILISYRMKKSFLLPSLLTLLVLPGVASAQLVDGNAGEFGELLITLVAIINTYLIPFILALAFLVFVWGMFKFFILGGANDEAKESGKSLIIYALAGFVLIVIFWGLVNFLATFTGVEGQDLKNLPEAPIPINGL